MSQLKKTKQSCEQHDLESQNEEKKYEKLISQIYQFSEAKEIKQLFKENNLSKAYKCLKQSISKQKDSKISKLNHLIKQLEDNNQIEAEQLKTFLTIWLQHNKQKNSQQSYQYSMFNLQTENFLNYNFQNPSFVIEENLSEKFLGINDKKLKTQYLKILNKNQLKNYLRVEDQMLFAKQAKYQFQIQNQKLQILNNDEVIKILDVNSGNQSCSFTLQWPLEEPEQIIITNQENSVQFNVATSLNCYSKLSNKSNYIFNYTKNEYNEQIIKVKVTDIQETGYCKFEAYDDDDEAFRITFQDFNLVDDEEIFIGHTPSQSFTLWAPYKDRRLSNARIFAQYSEQTEGMEIFIQENYDESQFAKECTLYNQIKPGNQIAYLIHQNQETVELLLQFPTLNLHLNIIKENELNIKVYSKPEN